MITSSNMVVDMTGNFRHEYVPRQPAPVQQRKKATVYRQVQPVHGNTYLTIKLTAYDESGELIKTSETTAQAGTQTSAIRSATFDFVHELNTEGFECTIR